MGLQFIPKSYQVFFVARATVPEISWKFMLNFPSNNTQRQIGKVEAMKHESTLCAKNSQ